MNCKTAYICGPLTELPQEIQVEVKNFYERIADAYYSATGTRAFVPHEHCDPVKHSTLKPCEVDAIERQQICEKTTVIVVIAIAPSWGGGIEVEMANNSGVPIIVAHPKGKKVSRLLLGNPAVREIVKYEDEIEAVNRLFNKFVIGRYGHEAA